MKLKYFLVVNVALALLFADCSAPESIKKEKTKPNTLVILADDLGYSDLGCYTDLTIKCRILSLRSVCFLIV